ncbi:hypothetical protein [Nocardiopsis synnemataformans]|uniref:hypothetical protein n=1 Tax=Nocardiopsis synnemataformans TaxID=61305 RepID=UPI003EBA7F70
MRPRTPRPRRSQWCDDESRDPSGVARFCVRDPGHASDHEDIHGRRWEPAHVALERLQERWGDTHDIRRSGHMWVALAHNPKPWATHIEPTPEQLEASIASRSGLCPPSLRGVG